MRPFSIGSATHRDYSDFDAMISIQAKKHDNYSVEFKFGFNCNEGKNSDDFSVNAWIFVPNSLGVNAENYGKKQFYRDVKSNVRLITPTYLLSEIAQEDSLPFTSLRNAMEILLKNPTSSDMDSYEYHLKMFAAIFKSSMRNHSLHIRNSGNVVSDAYLVDDYVGNTEAVLREFRSLFRIIDVPTVPEKPRAYFRLCDEFMSHVVSVQTVRIIKHIDTLQDHSDCSEIRARIVALIIAEQKYQEARGYGLVTDDDEQNRQLVYHRGMLKKFIESELYIRLDKKKDGVAVEQLYYSIAAGTAMIFATAVAWVTQTRYGNITWPLFVALVVSYMLKDRIKELMRFYFAHKLGNKYYDNKATITIGAKRVGEIKEGFDFISSGKLPADVRRLREAAAGIDEEANILEEKVMLYRKHLTMDNEALASNDNYPMRGINEIMRLHLTRFTLKMDNPEVPVDTLDPEGAIRTVLIDKIYYINVVFNFRHDAESEYHHYRIAMTRDGVLNVERL